MFTFEEIPNSRSISRDPPEVKIRYMANGEFSESIVESYAVFGTPTTVFTQSGTLYRGNISVDEQGWAQYVVSVTYGQRKKDVGERTFGFTTTGHTIHIKAAKEHINSYPDMAPDVPFDFFEGAIGVQPDGSVEGTDIVIPALKLNYGFRHPAGVVDEAFARQLARCTGRTNLDEFRGFQPGELLFLGASGQDGTETDAQVDYEFVASENATDLQIGQIMGIVKKGHHVAWIEFSKEVKSGKAATKPFQVHIERVYDEINFAANLGWN